MATKTLGLSGRDYSILAAWAAYANALSLAANEILEVYNDGGPVADTTSVTVGGWAANGFSVTIRPASGQGFGDNANRLTNALRWDSSLGAALTNSVSAAHPYVFGGANLTVQDLQFRASHASATSCIAIATNPTTINRSIISMPNSTLGSCVVQSSGSVTINDSLIQSKLHGVLCNDFNAVRLNNCTVAGASSTGKGIRQPYAAGPIIKNTVVIGFTTDYEGASGAGSTNNATDKATFGGSGFSTSGQTSVSSADFENLTIGSEDFRIKPGSTKLIGTGASSIGSGQDIVKTTRTVPYSIGAWQASAATGTTLTPGKGSLVFTGYQPTVTQAASGNHTQDPGTGHLVFTGKAMSVARTVGFYSEPMTNENGGLLVSTIIPQVTVQRVSDLGIVDFNLKSISTDTQGRINIRDATGILVSGDWYCLATCGTGANPLSGNRAYQAS